MKDMGELEEAVLKTLAYSDVFDYPLTAEEVHRFLTAKRSFTLGEVSIALSQMSADLRLASADDYYFLPGRGEAVDLRRSHKASSQSKLSKAQKIAHLLKFIPWIKMVGVTGKLAMEDSDKEDDIDLMIITLQGRLWLSRGLVVTLLLLTNQYRRPGKVKDKICPNLILSEEALELPERNLYTAHEVTQMKPLWEKDNMYQRFLWKNRWVRNFLPNFQPPNHFDHHPRGNFQFSIFNSLVSTLEHLAMKLQLKYMASKKTTEVTTASIIRFHPQDARDWVLEKYQKRLSLLHLD